jgi:hypothetical protein
MLYGILISVGIFVTSFSFGYFNDVKIKDQIALSCLLAGGGFAATAGFMLDRAIGVGALSVVSLMFAFLFGYERG